MAHKDDKQISQRMVSEIGRIQAEFYDILKWPSDISRYFDKLLVFGITIRFSLVIRQKEERSIVHKDRVWYIAVIL